MDINFEVTAKSDTFYQAFGEHHERLSVRWIGRPRGAIETRRSFRRGRSSHTDPSFS